MRCKRKDGTLFITLATNIALFDTAGELRYVLAINRDLTAEEWVRLTAHGRARIEGRLRSGSTARRSEQQARDSERSKSPNLSGNSRHHIFRGRCFVSAACRIRRRRSAAPRRS
jgi:hypothetical protein